jgi:hypothetical protein
MIVAALLMFGVTMHRGRWTSSDSGGRLRRAGVLVMGSLDRRRRCSGAIFFVLGCYFQSSRSVCVNVLTYLVNEIPFGKKTMSSGAGVNRVPAAVMPLPCGVGSTRILA